jgi:hypothetical protein
MCASSDNIQEDQDYVDLTEEEYEDLYNNTTWLEEDIIWPIEDIPEVSDQEEESLKKLLEDYINDIEKEDLTCQCSLCKQKWKEYSKIQLKTMDGHLKAPLKIVTTEDMLWLTPDEDLRAQVAQAVANVTLDDQEDLPWMPPEEEKWPPKGTQMNAELTTHPPAIRRKTLPWPYQSSLGIWQGPTHYRNYFNMLDLKP